MYKPIVRFAPSPTGYMHVGNIRTALINFLFAKKNEGKFFLRIDDTDHARCKDEYFQGILKDLEWLGIKYDEIFFQSKRLEKYDVIRDELIQKGRLYPCYETAEELEAKRKILLSRGKPPVYDRSHLKLTESEKKRFEAENRKPHYRFLLPDEDIVWKDLVRNEVKINTRTMSDPILIREDGSYLYTLPSIVDDLDMNITHVLRGEDHIYNTAAQIPIYKAIRDNFNIQFGHTSFLTGPEGEALSKRLGSISIKDLRLQDVEPMALLSYLSCLGTPKNIEPKYHLSALLDEFDVQFFGGNNPKFNIDILKEFNKKWISHASYINIKQLDVGNDITEEVWELIKFNVEGKKDIKIWNRVFSEEFSGKLDLSNAEFYKISQKLLPDNIDEETWYVWTNAIKEQTGRKGRDLYQPLRQALTGFDHGPEMKKILPLLPREVILKRLLPN